MTTNPNEQATDAVNRTAQPLLEGLKLGRRHVENPRLQLRGQGDKLGIYPGDSQGAHLDASPSCLLRLRHVTPPPARAGRRSASLLSFCPTLLPP